MWLFKKTIDFLIYSNCWIGLGAAALTAQFYIILNIEVNVYVVLFSFFATQLTYTFQRYVKVVNQVQLNNSRLRWMKKNLRLVQIIITIASIGSIRALIEFNWKTYLVLAILGLISFFYIVKLPTKNASNLRDIPRLKLFLIGLVWASTSTLIPYLNLSDKSVEFPWLLGLTNFIFTIAITIPFDIRDIELDEAEKKTVPQLVGVNTAIIIATILLIVNYPLLMTCIEKVPWMLAIATLLSISLVIGAKKKRDDFYFSFLMDSLLIVQPIAIYYDVMWLS